MSMTDAAPTFQGVLEEAMSEPVPEPADDIVTITGVPVAGQYQPALVRIRELTGADEEAIARTKTTTAMFRLILERCVETIGNKKPEPADFDNLLLGDRDTILLGIWAATYGAEYETTIVCPKCERQAEMAFDLKADIPVKKLDDRTVVRTVELRKPGTYAKLRLVAVADQEEAMAEEGRTIPELNTITLGRVVSELNGSPTLGPQTMRSLNSGDRQRLVKHLNDNAPGPRLGEVTAECPHCGRESEFALNLAVMFL